MRNLKKLRKERCLNQMDMAEELGMPQSTYQQYEAGINEPNIENLIKIADYFKVTIDFLIGRTDIREPLLPVEQELSHNLTEIRNAKAKDALLTLIREIRQDND